MDWKSLFIYLGATLVGCLLIYASDRLDKRKNWIYYLVYIKILALGVVLSFFGGLLTIEKVWELFHH
jgi:hypothetical protein